MAISRDDIISKFGELTKAATNKVEEITERSKISFEISEKEKELAELFRELGKVTYEGRHGESDVITAQTLIRIIDDKADELEELRSKKAAKRKPYCKTCGVDTNDNHDFCPKCGTKIERNVEVVDNYNFDNDNEEFIEVFGDDVIIIESDDENKDEE